MRRIEAGRTPLGPDGCYCRLPDDGILDDIVRIGVPEEALVRICCWAQVCRVRVDHSTTVSDDVWRQLCARRGYLMGRQNPRGF